MGQAVGVFVRTYEVKTLLLTNGIGDMDLGDLFSCFFCKHNSLEDPE